MQKFKDLIKEELSGWKPFDVIWLTFVCVFILIFSISMHQAWYNIVAAVCGVICVVLGGKGKLSNYFFGFIDACLMIYIAFRATYYGDMALSVYNLVMQFVGFATWSKHMNKETHSVSKRHLSNPQRLLVLLGLVASTLLVGFLMGRFTDNQQPYVDGFKLSASVIAMLLMVTMCTEQWWIWIAINISGIVLYGVSLYAKGEPINIAITIKYLVYFVNSIIMCYWWEREVRENKKP